DVVSKVKGVLFFKQVIVPPSKKGQLTISDVCFAYTVDYIGENPEASNLRLIRNGFRIIPNPLSVYGTEDSTLSLYAEAYDLSFSRDFPYEYELLLAVMGEDSTFYRNFGGRVAQQMGTSIVIAESFDIRSWPPGLYYVRLTVTDLESGASDTTWAPFRIVSRADLLASAVVQQAFDPYDTLSLKAKERIVVYLLTPAEKATLSRLTVQGKIRFLDQYWQEHDSDPSTSEIENRREMIRRFEYSNRLFSSYVEKTDGWLTDRGRIHMIYGFPDDVKDVPAPRLVKPYAIWSYYHIKEGRFFIFEDSKGDNDYRLVHSNVLSEIYSREWQEKIDRGELDVIDF
ncbi:MAG: GWxTD domain-containing protein, partial [candidate division Zixibacteria bacterium]|nr:GWxTD domain-containing protein [candidate division Zixibacteria bacterium]